jgi:hypothetical protein
MLTEGSGSGFVQINYGSGRIQEVNKHTDPTDPDPEHWFLVNHYSYCVSLIVNRFLYHHFLLTFFYIDGYCRLLFLT